MGRRPLDAANLRSEVYGNTAASIQAALAVTLERAIAAATLLLREALVGRVRASEAKAQARANSNERAISGRIQRGWRKAEF